MLPRQMSLLAPNLSGPFPVNDTARRADGAPCPQQRSWDVRAVYATAGRIRPQQAQFACFCCAEGKDRDPGRTFSSLWKCRHGIGDRNSDGPCCQNSLRVCQTFASWLISKTIPSRGFIAHDESVGTSKRDLDIEILQLGSRIERHSLGFLHY